MWGEKPALLHHAPPDYPAAFWWDSCSQKHPWLCFPALIKCILAASLRAPWSRMAAPRPSGQRKPLLPCSCRAINPGVLSPATPAWGLSANVLLLLLFLHLPPPLGLSLRRGKGQWHLGSVQAAPRVPLPCATSLTHQPLHPNTFTCVLLPRGRAACPITPLPRAFSQLGDSHPAAPGFVLALCPAVATHLVSWDTAAQGCRRHRLC